MPNYRRYGRRRAYKRKRWSFRKTAKKRYYGRKKARRPANTMLVKKNNFLPTMFKFHTRYHSYKDLGGFSVLNVGQRISCNGLYDPDKTGAGHQPMGFDQVMPLYDHYVVIAAKLTIQWTNEGDVVPAQVGCYINDAATSLTSVDEICENGYNKSVVLGVRGQSDSTRTMVISLNPNKFLGRSKPLADPDLKGRITTNPNEECYFDLWASPNDGVSTMGNVIARYTVEYVAMMIEPRKLTTS